ncbi:MAG TPA: TonB-dependent receptor [Candidatus Elarobacter sp.]|nr:TonB-dependent receptor [Candidatus Elarobacter sp.]
MLTLVALLAQGTSVLAGTTGSISGVLTEATSASTPISGATVSAVSPSQSAKTTTDQQGRFSFITLAPDTYNLSFEKAGYQSASQGGITVQADQNVTISLQGSRALQQIGRTSARASNALVRPGQTASVYSVNAAQQTAGASLGGGANLNQAYSAIASVPGVVVPMNQPGWGTSIFIRGGDYTQTGNEVDGIPINRSFDQYASGQLSSLGNQEIQVYTGQAPADAQAVGLAGFVNQVIRTGTYPGFVTGTIGVGAPHKYNHANLELAGASPDRLFSYYLATGGYSETFRNLDQFNGAGYLSRNGFGTLYNFVAANCGTAHPTAGCYNNTSPFLGGPPLGPNGYAVGDTLWGFTNSLNDRESIANLHFGIPHKKSGGHDDVQILYDYGNVQNYANSSLLDWNKNLNDVVNGTVGSITNNAACPPPPGSPPTTCAAGVAANYLDANQYGGRLGVALTPGDLTNIRRFAWHNSPAGRLWGGPVDPARQDGETNAFAIVKGQYQHNIADKGYIRLYGYSLYSDRLDSGIQGIFQTFTSSVSPDYYITSHSRGAVLTSGYQLSPEHLLNLNLGFVTSNTSRYRNDVAAGAAAESPVAYLVSSANPTGTCYVRTGTAPGAPIVPVTCGNAAQYRLPGVNSLGTSLAPRVFRLPNGAIDPRFGSPTLGDLATATCGGAPCEYLVINDGRFAANNTVRPKFFNASISDTWKPNARISVDLSLRADTYSYEMQNTNTTGNQLFVNDYNARHCIAGTSITGRAFGTACPAGTAPTALNANSPNLTYADILQPRVGATFTVNPDNVLRASYGRFVQPPETSSVEATNVQSGTPSTLFYSNFGFASFARPILPEYSYNTDFSWEHQVRGTDVSTRITPFYRKTQNEFATVLVDPKTNFVAFVNGQNRTASGFELAINKGDFGRDGFAGTLAYTYTHAVNHYRIFNTGGSFVFGANTAIQAYNAYTSFCTTHSTDARCANPNGVVGAPCYTAGGTADPACAAGSIANPYWNAPAQGLLDPTAGYPAYNQEPSAGTGASTSYVIPHVASLIVQYKKGPWKFTPALQFQAGARYGTPFSTFGVAPDTCGALPGNPSASGDPRYQQTGAPAPPGAGYDASSCTGVLAIPNLATKRFDGIGQFVQPNVLNMNLQVAYEINKRFTLQITGANLLATCWGGSNVPWAIGGRVGCSYIAGQSVGNFYNPGDRLQQGFTFPYGPVTAGSLQAVATNSAPPPQIYVELKIRRL